MFKFPKSERLNKKKIIDNIFEGGRAKSFSTFPLRVVYIDVSDTEAENTQVLVSVSKRRFKHAVDRNRIKRHIREAYRLNKNGFLDLLNSKNTKLAIAFIYISNEKSEFRVLDSKMKFILSKISESV